ncbi:MAG: Formamidopyrimidine-DNA glycosylase (EC [uncultured Thiotrichaceae bacterium]|uniref:Formamidopyrimidine-DNA glycosylase n=1 Tax=uncultured Thiotrichaceae bacterium TaxID=298394 RepID=A0A6S6U6X5_9GAMM|nr:MAG: Formamidopyrimidine-DNA glycosylase (EC [uncultured Thiotrichaceae bacterium]
MPELPEVETTRKGIAPHVCGNVISEIVVRQPKLRWPVPDQLQQLVDAAVTDVARRGKYLLLETINGTCLIHLGMSGSLRITNRLTPPEKHDHVDIIFTNEVVLRLRDPRRFGAVLWAGCGELHPLLIKLGPEPLTAEFSGEYLFKKSRNRRINVKAFIMDSHMVVGVGNIYANEALFAAGIDPRKAAGEISAKCYVLLVAEIKKVLQQAIEQGGTTLRDFVREDGRTGYFQVALKVYGRSGETCVACGTMLQQIKQAQRSSWFCSVCQQ